MSGPFLLRRVKDGRFVRTCSALEMPTFTDSPSDAKRYASSLEAAIDMAHRAFDKTGVELVDAFDRRLAS